MNTSKIKRVELLIYLVIWLIVLLMPLFLESNTGNVEWRRITREWFRITPFFLVFIVHNFLLFPSFFTHKKYLLYFLSTFAMIVLASILINEFGYLINNIREPLPTIPPRRLSPEIIPRPRLIQRPKELIVLDDIIISILVVGFNMAIKLSVKWQSEEQKNKELEKEKLQTELAFLKNQVSPHFFMNTLNNIHALIDINGENAKESIIKLSKLMRYLLYDSETGETTLLKEIEFIRNYVDLMKLRFLSNVKIELSFPEIIPEIKVPPLLFTSLIENAFKHGISYQADSFVGIYLRVQEKDIIFRIKNSIHENNLPAEKGGLGLKNLEKRLELLYGKDYSLIHFSDDKFFEINVKIPLNGD